MHPSDPRVVDRIAISDRLALYCHNLDDYNIDGVAECFTDDCIFDPGPGNGGRRQGRAEIFPAQKVRMGVFRRTHHQLGQSVVTFQGADDASSETYVIAWHQRWDMSIGISRLRYLDRLVRHGEDWLIRERVLVELGVEGFNEGTWNASPRRPVAETLRSAASPTPPEQQ